MFHLKDGWYFERTAMGDVKIVKKASPMSDAPVVAEIVVPPNEWASVVASVCFDGANAETFGAMQEFHNAGLLRTPTDESYKADEVAKLEGYIAMIPGALDQGESAVDTAIRLLQQQFVTAPELDPNQGDLPLNTEDKTVDEPALVDSMEGKVEPDEPVLPPEAA